MCYYDIILNDYKKQKEIKMIEMSVFEFGFYLIFSCSVCIVLGVLAARSYWG